MNKLFWLTSIAYLYCMTAFAQQEANDSTATTSMVQAAAGDSIIVHFSCTIIEHVKVLLQWDADSIEAGDFFIVERSNGGSVYETIGALKGAGNGNLAKYELTDNAPFNGSNFYRIKYTGKRSESACSKAVQVTLSQSAAFKFYPNPVDKLLIIKIDHHADMQILSSLGVLRIARQLQPGIQVINVSELEKGNYLLRITDKESSRSVLEQLVKN